MRVLNASIAGLLSAAASVALAGPDLILDNVAFTEIIPRPGFVTIGFTYDIVNIGDAEIDLGGPDPDSLFDNAGIQTLLADEPDLSGGVHAAAGAAIFDPVVLGPGERYSGVFQSNTSLLPDPTQLGDFRWLVIDLNNTTEGPYEQHNNRLIVWVPEPCGLADLAPPLGLLDLADITLFAEAFLNQEPLADLDANGLFDLSDVVQFVEAFLAGC